MGDAEDLDFRAIITCNSAKDFKQVSTPSCEAFLIDAKWSSMSIPTPQLIVQPDDGTAPVLELIRRAKETLLLKQFTFTEPEILEAVLTARKNGVRIRVMLNSKRSGGSRANDDTFAALEKGDVEVRWASSKFYVTHEKSIVVDNQSALIATFNLCEKYFTQTRDYGVVVHDPAKVAQVVNCFEADWNEQDWQPEEDSGLLWSNNRSREAMAYFIDSAQTSLFVQHPKFVDATVLDRIVAAVDRGVKVRVLCGGKHGISECDILDTFSSLRVMHRAGAKVHKQKNLRLHAKLILADGERAIIGSMNIDRSAFDLRRELGTIVSDAAIVDRLNQVFESDWELSHHYDTPDPLDPELHKLETDFPHDPDLHHE